MQLPLLELDDAPKAPASLLQETFSHAELCPQEARLALERRYGSLLEQTERFNRRLVSFQGNRQALVHSWSPYREGFSAELVRMLADEMALAPGDSLLEPFSGSATTLLVAKLMGLDAVGVELLPICHLMWEAKAQLHGYDVAELQQIAAALPTLELPAPTAPFPHLAITQGAFPVEQEAELMGLTAWVEQAPLHEATRLLLRLLLASLLEDVSYTRKDGQYLRWDSRSSKVQQRNAARLQRGQKALKPFDKGEIVGVRVALGAALATVLRDIRILQQGARPVGTQRLERGSVLEILPTLDGGQFDAVITSPPYCNRYDYTRTYALELAYLGVGEKGIRALRQSLLSCTVENRPKVAWLEAHYQRLGRHDEWARILQVSRENPALQEINQALRQRWERGEINNKGILAMVEGYFTELTFVFAELHRLCRPGAQVAFVNDNVRYGGEIIPVDLLSTDLAVQLGFEPVKVYVLPQRKGNSSQQMGRFGRVALRKSITLWRKR